MTKQEQQKRFRQLAHELSSHFPDLDIAFGMSEEDNKVYCQIDDDQLEIYLDEMAPEELVYEAIFALKELRGRFDA